MFYNNKKKKIYQQKPNLITPHKKSLMIKL